MAAVVGPSPLDSMGINEPSKMTDGSTAVED